VFVFDYLPLP